MSVDVYSYECIDNDNIVNFVVKDGKVDCLHIMAEGDEATIIGFEDFLMGLQEACDKYDVKQFGGAMEEVLEILK